ncbi:hypothetical protein DID80_08370 [Candidatus Marinamargulisbacteria bacterium SCGC AAA071-K20]|nr:hypothetical protein DID80_08370 [Candidatus Marinamargulisbacteria bacterium SCGC AAA071-K20]
MIKRGIILLLSCLFLSISVGASSLDQATIENNFTRLGQESLDTMFGPGNFILRVRVQLSDSQYKVKYTEQSNPKLNKKKGVKEQVYILPGVPALKNLAPDAFNKLPYDSITTMIKPKVKRMQATLIVKKEFSKKEARKAEALVKSLLGFKQGRDKIKLEYKNFYWNEGNSQPIKIFPGPEKLLSLENLFRLLLLLFIVVVSILYFINQSKIAKLSIAKGEGGGSSGGGPNISINPNIELPEGSGGGGAGGDMSMSGESGIKKYFNFITLDNVENFVFLLKKEKIGPDYISIILSFIPSRVAAKVMAEYEPGIQAQIAAGLVDQRMTKPETLDKLEETVKNSLECFVGGKSKFKGVFDSIGNTEKKKLMQLLKGKNPQAYQKARQYVLLFDDIKYLSDSELQEVMSEANVELLSTALVSVEQDLYQRIYANLSETSKSMVEQFLDLKGDSTSKKDIEAAQDYLLKLIEKWDESGKIDLRSKIKG